MAKCYRAYDNATAPFPEATDYSPCLLDSNSCCGKNSVCVGYNMCYSNTNTTNGMDYYVAGCTDINYSKNNPACQQNCMDEHYPALVWRSEINKWACCRSTQNGQLGNRPDCANPDLSDTFSAPSRQDLDNYRAGLNDVSHVARLAAGVIAAIVIGAVIVSALGCFCLWKCCFSRKARDKRNRGKFVPLGNTHRGEDIWNANVQDHNQGTELHDGPGGNYGYGGAPHTGGAPYNPPQQSGPQYTVANFR